MKIWSIFPTEPIIPKKKIRATGFILGHKNEKICFKKIRSGKKESVNELIYRINKSKTFKILKFEEKYIKKVLKNKKRKKIR